MAEKIKDVEVLSRESHDSLGISRQLADLRNLKDGWADGMQPADQWGEGYGKARWHRALIGWRERLPHGTQTTFPHHISTQHRKAACHWNGLLAETRLALK